MLVQFGGLSAMRTGTRCTTLIQLPDAFCGGSRANAPPVPGARPSTRPWKVTSLAVKVGMHRGGLTDADMGELAFP